MDLVEGRTLKRRLHPGEGETKIPLVRALEAMCEVARAVEHAHEQGVVHRDLKPENVILDAGDHAHVLDFGLALVREARTKLTKTGASMGTPAYMPPEQVAGERGADERSDVYSLGATLYHVLTGRPPFEGATEINVLAAVLRKDPVPPRSHNARVAADLETICLKCLEKDPGKRYTTAGALADEIERYLAGEPIVARPIGRLARLARRAWRRKVATTLVLVAASGLVAAVGLALARAAREHDLAEAEAARHREEQRANEKAEEAERAGDVIVLRDLEKQADELWPAVSAVVPAMEKWLTEAGELVGCREKLRARLEVLNKQLARGPVTGAKWTKAEQFEREWLKGLVDGIEELAGKDGDGAWRATIKGVEARRTLAREVAKVSREADWETARAQVNANSRHGGYELDPIEGLVPIGCDPDSGLLELWHVSSGDRPRRDESGHLILTEKTGLVLVLVPGGSFTMGSKTGRPDQGPPHTVVVRAFYLSKCEMTQGQWLRATGENPSTYKAGNNVGGRAITLRHPVEGVSWDDCDRVLRRLDLALPSEAQWEYAARAGTETEWWTGSDERSLEGAANLADEAYKRYGGTTNPIVSWDDGHAVHAPVGSFKANAFGLHDVVGNLWEWTNSSSYNETAQNEFVRVFRGGSWSDSADAGGSASRWGSSAAYRSHVVGVRPAR
jgi:formylglycine-generating enzyme required for sulfatase activity